MSKLSAKEETRLLKAVERSIDLSSNGMSPNDAIEKVAREEQYTPPFITRIVNAFNKSKSVAVFTKEASPAKKKENFAIASAEEIVKRIYGADKEASAKDSLQFPGDMHAKAPMQKVAFAQYDEFASISPWNKVKLVDAYKDAKALFLKRAHDKEASARLAFEETLDRASDLLKRENGGGLKKIAQLIVNGYPEQGTQLLKLLSKKTGKDIPILDKCAEVAVFPPAEPYLTLANVFVAGDKWAKAICDNDYLQKQADIVDSAVETVAEPAELVKSLVGGGESAAETAAIKADPNKILEPTAYNDLKKIKSLTTFYDLANYDSDLAMHDMPTLMKAYNHATALNPESATNPAMIKPLMLQYLNQGGVIDVAQLGQIAKIRKDLTSMDMDKERLMLEKKKLAELNKPESWTSKFKGEAAADGKSITGKLVGATLSKLTPGDSKDKEKGKSIKDQQTNEKSVLEKNLVDSTGKKISFGKIMGDLNSSGIKTNPDAVIATMAASNSGQTLTADQQAIMNVISNLRNW